MGSLALAAPFAEQSAFAQPAALTFPFPVAGTWADGPKYDRYLLPLGVWEAAGLPHVALEGEVQQSAWQLDAPKASLAEVVAPLRDQFRAAGYEVVLDCESRECGGFDFRFAIKVLPEPQMHVDLNEFRFLSFRRQGDAASLLVSRSGDAAFVQITTVTGSGGEAVVLPQTRPTAGGDGAETSPIAAGEPPSVTPEPPATPQIPTPDLAAALTDIGARLDAGISVGLDDLVFASGASSLEAGDYASLKALVAWLDQDASRKLFLVGHTDSSGALPANTALSGKRAEAVRMALIRNLGVKEDRVIARGVGPLSPRAGNNTEAGRQANRRVEAVPAGF